MPDALRGVIVRACLDAGVSNWLIRDFAGLPSAAPLSSYLTPFPEQARGDWSWRGYGS